MKLHNGNEVQEGREAMPSLSIQNRFLCFMNCCRYLCLLCPITWTLWSLNTLQQSMTSENPHSRDPAVKFTLHWGLFNAACPGPFQIPSVSRDNDTLPPHLSLSTEKEPPYHCELTEQLPDAHRTQLRNTGDAEKKGEMRKGTNGSCLHRAIMTILCFIIHGHDI